MAKIVKRFVVAMGIVLLLVATLLPLQAFADLDLQLTKEEEAFVSQTQTQAPLPIGIIPHTFPLSACPPEVPEYMGVNVEMLNLITEKTGLQFEYRRIPIEQNSPFVSLQNKEFALVAGTIRLDSFTSNPELLLSNRFCDGSAVCVAKRNAHPNALKTGKIAVMSGYQAGMEFSKEQFSNHEIVLYPNNQEVMKAVRSGKTDLAMISRYVGVYELQNPLNEQLAVLAPYQKIVDSCIMGLNTPETQIAISIINKALAQIGEEEYNHVQMNFSLTHPYKLTGIEFLFKYRYIFAVGIVAFLILLFMSARLLSSQKEGKKLARDLLTGAFRDAGFELTVAKIISKSNRPLFLTDFDISHFSSFNELHGKDKGDELLKQIVKIVTTFLCEQDAICRSYADHFKVLVCKDTIEDVFADIQKATLLFNQLVETRMVFNFGVYPITDPTMPISKMLDFAEIAKKTVKGQSETYIGVFDHKLHERHINDVKMMAAFDHAVAQQEFIAYYQPKFDVFTRKVIGAEALVRWKTGEGTMIPPGAFIDLFERNGQIQRLDFYMLKQVCQFQKNMLEQGLLPVTISVNFSRVHLFSGDFIPKINQIVTQYGIPNHLIEIECTETTMTCDTDRAIDILGKLQAQGFTIAMDDFGQAYSSLNTLRAIPLDFVKLDRGFLLATLEEEKLKANMIIKNVVSLVHDLSLKIVAEGVETEEQYQFLKSLGCDYIQGYYFSKPLDEQTFYRLLQNDAQ